jgi:hypothetical protein
LRIENVTGAGIEVRAIDVELQDPKGDAIGLANSPSVGRLPVQIAQRSYLNLAFFLPILPGATPLPGVLQANASGLHQNGVPWQATASQVLQQ